MSEDQSPLQGWMYAYHQIVTQGTAATTRRAHRRDVAYFFAWAYLRMQCEPAYPISKDLLMLFLIEHRGNMPKAIEDALVVQGKRRHAGLLTIRTLRRIVGSLSVAHDEAGVTNPCRDAQLRLLLKKARNTGAERSYKKAAITPDILAAMLSTCTDGLRGLRDRALLLVGFATGGRRRSELAGLDVCDFTKVADGYLVRIQRSKTDQGGRGLDVPLTGEGARSLEDWLQSSGLVGGRLFRGIHRSGRLTNGMTGETINAIVKRRISLIGMDPAEYGAHSLRSGFMTTASRRGISLQDAMALSGHRSERVANGYYRPEAVFANPASRLIGCGVQVNNTE